MDPTSGVALELKTGIPCYQVETLAAEFTYCFNCQSGRKIKNRKCLWRGQIDFSKGVG
jgi:hypothetical protein